MNHNELIDELRSAVRDNRPAQVRGAVWLDGPLDFSEVFQTNRHGGLVIQGGGSLPLFYQGWTDNDQNLYGTGYSAICGSRSKLGDSPLILTTGENIVWRDLSLIGKDLRRQDARLSAAIHTRFRSGWASGSHLFSNVVFDYFDDALLFGEAITDGECDQTRTRDCWFRNCGSAIRTRNWQSVDHHFGGQTKLTDVDTFAVIEAGGKISVDTISSNRLKTLFDFHRCTRQVNYYDVRSLSVDANKGNPCIARVRPTCLESPSVHIGRLVAINNTQTISDQPLVFCDGAGVSVTVDHCDTNPASRIEANASRVKVQLNGVTVLP